MVSNSGTHVSTTQLAAIETRSSVTSQPSPVEAASTPTRDESSSPSSLSTHSESQRRSSARFLGEGTSISSSRDGEQQTSVTQSTKVHSVTEAISSLSSMSSPVSVVSPTPSAAEHPHLHSHESDIHTSTTLSSQPGNPPPIPPLVPQTPAHAQPSSQWSGESIYRTIMNRLTILEANHTLHARYVEEQTAGVREVLRRLNEEVGRLESVVGGPTFATN